MTKEDLNIGLLYCKSCDEVVEHRTPIKGAAICLTCGSKSHQGTASLQTGESMAITHAEKSIRERIKTLPPLTWKEAKREINRSSRKTKEN